MASKNSYPKLITDFAELLEAVNRNPDVQPAMEPERQALTQTLAEIQSLRARQAELKALKQSASQQLKAAMAKAKEQSTQVKSITKGKIGPKNELLVQFKVVPQRKRPRKPQEEVKKPSGENPGAGQGSTDPATPASPSVKEAA
jgi:chromosome segregation ATPase